MKFENIKLGVGKAELFVYKPDTAPCKKPMRAMMVIPGGGYGVVCTEREGEPIALAYLAKGFTSFVLHYSVGKDAPVNCPLAEASAAMAYIRRNAGYFGIDPKKVYAVGFSAGGHLCGSLATLWHRPDIIRKAGIEYEENRPDGVVLCYPVITSGKYSHRASFENLIGADLVTGSKLDEYSLERCVDKRSAPAFIIHTAEDETVPVQNSLCMAKAYADIKIPFELHVYPCGPHGLALANDVTSGGDNRFVDSRYCRWVDDSIAFLDNL